MAENIINQFLKVQNRANWTESKKKEVDANGQIVFVPGEIVKDDNNAVTSVSVDSIYAKEGTFGDGALSSKTLLTENITVEGGPLSDLLKAKNMKEIKAGTDLQALLKSLFCVELWSTGIKPYTGKLTLSQTAATISGMKSGFVEVGTEYTTYVTGNVVTVNRDPSYVSGFDYSYIYKGDTKTKVTNGKYSLATSDVTYTFTGMPKVNMSLTSYNIVDKQITSVAYSDKDIKISYSLTAYAAPGTNTLTVKTKYNEVGTYTIPAISGVYDCSNLGAKGTTEYKTNKVDHQSTITIADKTETKTFTGVYPIYFNGTKYTDSNADGAEIDTTNVAASDTLQKSNEIFSGSKDLYVKFPKQDANSWKIAIPDYYTGTTISGKAFDGLVSKKYSIDVTFSKTSTTGFAYCGTGNNVKYSYYIWESTGTSGANGVKLTFNLK